ncbi:MAG: lytic transglycosylase domain-containing protein [Clostridia bacterium]|nr:lytic transglycosylase domain-containing protein [Deltaproteobacteria bacterium]
MLNVAHLFAVAGVLLAREAHAVPLERIAPMPISQPVEQQEAELFESLPPDPAIASGLSSDVRGVSGTTGRSPGQLSYRLDDTSQLLPQPKALEDKIHFWESIYLRHGSDQVVIHDRESQAVIWRVVELPKLTSGAIDEKAGKIEVAAQLVDLKERLNRLATTLTAQDDEDRALLMLAGDGTISHLDGAADRLRTQRGVADKFASAQPRAAKLRAEIEKTLVEEGVPKELAMLPFIESMFNPQARSSVGALGLWQLMPGTARWLGLTLTKTQDDRLDTVKATRAAAKLLRKNYELLGTWPLAITAYNHGQNGLKRAVEEAGTTDLVYLVTSYSKENWGFSSKNFYAGFLAACRSFEAVEQTHGRANGTRN